MELDDMYRGKCPDGDRCLHGCHTSERCFYAKDAEGCWIDCEDDHGALILLTGSDSDAAIDAAMLAAKVGGKQ